MTTTSLLHYNDCAAEITGDCTCEPPLTTVEEVTRVLVACHVLEFIDADSGWACGCDEDGYLELLTLDAAYKHQADAMLTVLRPLLAQELVESAEIVREFAQSHPITSAEARAIFDGIATSLSLPASKETPDAR